MSCVIPILPVELYQFETYERILGVMDYVEKLFDTTMDCVSGRVISNQIIECRNKVNGLSSRINSARSRIAQAKGSTKPLNIFSAPSFPKLENEDDQLLPLQKPMPRYHPTVHETEHPGQAPRGTTTDVSILHSMYMKLKIPTPSMLDLPQQHKEIGLGQIPEDISNSSSFLLFNSHSNPYNMDFTEIAVEKKQTNNDRTVSVALPEAPKSMQESEDFSKFGKTDFVYQPDTKETPKVDLPAQLNIPGIANLDWDDDEDDDFSSNFAFGATKAPSQGTSSTPKNTAERPQEKMPALPSLPGLESKPASNPPPQQTKAPPAPPAPAQQTVSRPPPPPPPQSNSRPPPPPPPPPSSKAPPPPPPKDLPFNPSQGDRGQMLAAIKARQENPLAGLKKTETVDKSGPIIKSGGAAPSSSGKKDPFSLLKEQIGLRFNAIHAPAVTDKTAKKPAVMTEAKKGHDSDSYSD